MKIWTYANQKLYVLGIKIAEVKIKSRGAYFNIFGLPIYHLKFISTMSKFLSSNQFDARKYDKLIAKKVDGIHVKSFNQKPKNVAFLATMLYDSGGHTKCIRDLTKSMKSIYTQKLFLTRKSKPLKILDELNSFIEVQDFNIGFSIKDSIRNIVNQIIAFQPKVVFGYIHPDDFIGASVLAVLKKLNIKILFFDHASHYPTLGMSFADLILEGMPSTEKLTWEKRGFKNTKIVGLQSLQKGETKYYSHQELKELKNQIGVSSENLITMSGGSSYKFFDKETSPYLEMIKRLLLKEPNLTHIWMTELQPLQKIIFDKILDDKNLKKRVIILPFQKEFDKYFQLADVFIDSFPVSAALTQIDLMRNRVASVVKINREVPHFSFHEYQMPNYPYMFEKESDMERAILELLHDKQKRDDIIEKNYNFWLTNYESDIFRDKIINIIEEKI